MQCSYTNRKEPGGTTNNFTLPFNVEYANTNPNGGSQPACNTNMCLLPGGPIVPTQSIFPSSLPNEYRPSTTNVDTNYLNVKKVGSICNLRANNLTVDSGNNESTTSIQFRNLPQINNSGNTTYSNLFVDNEGNLYRSAIESNNSMTSTNTNTNTNTKHFRQPSYHTSYHTPYQNQNQNQNQYQNHNQNSCQNQNSNDIQYAYNYDTDGSQKL